MFLIVSIFTVFHATFSARVETDTCVSYFLIVLAIFLRHDRLMSENFSYLF